MTCNTFICKTLAGCESRPQCRKLMGPNYGLNCRASRRLPLASGFFLMHSTPRKPSVSLNLFGTTGASMNLALVTLPEGKGCDV